MIASRGMVIIIVDNGGFNTRLVLLSSRNALTADLFFVSLKFYNVIIVSNDLVSQPGMHSLTKMPFNLACLPTSMSWGLPENQNLANFFTSC